MPRKTKEQHQADNYLVKKLLDKNILKLCPNTTGGEVPFYTCECCLLKPCSKWHIVEHLKNSRHSIKQRAYEQRKHAQVSSPVNTNIQERISVSDYERIVNDLECKMNLEKSRGDALQQRVNKLEQEKPNNLMEIIESKDQEIEYLQAKLSDCQTQLNDNQKVIMGLTNQLYLHK